MWELDYKESWVPKNWCFWTVVLEKTLESPLDCKEAQPVHPKGDRSVLGVHWRDWCWSWNSNTLATWYGELTHVRRSWCWERLRAGEGDNRWWDGWMASPTQWTWVWVDSGSWWWTGRSGVLQFVGSQRVRHNRATELLYKILFSLKPQHESAIGTHISPPFWTSLPSPIPSHPSRLIQSPFEYPQLYSKFLLAIYFTYGNVSFHVTGSTHLTLSSPLPMSVSLLSMSVSPLLPCK